MPLVLPLSESSPSAPPRAVAVKSASLVSIADGARCPETVAARGGSRRRSETADREDMTEGGGLSAPPAASPSA